MDTVTWKFTWKFFANRRRDHWRAHCSVSSGDLLTSGHEKSHLRKRHCWRPLPGGRHPAHGHVHTWDSLPHCQQLPPFSPTLSLAHAVPPSGMSQLPQILSQAPADPPKPRQWATSSRKPSLHSLPVWATFRVLPQAPLLARPTLLALSTSCACLPTSAAPIKGGSHNFHLHTSRVGRSNN